MQMRCFFILFFCFHHLIEIHANQQKPVVVGTKNGRIEGETVESEDNFLVNTFLGIPYGNAERFAKPKAVEPWNETLQAKNWPPRCIQHLIFGGLEDMPSDNEDCLYLNLFAPHQKNSQENSNGYPVMVFVHGGGFALGSSLDYGLGGIVNWLVPKGVVLINFHYRVGPLGFFSVGTKETAGNWGLWDQTLLLSWVKENVASFGGDPAKVTVFGQSAGAISTGLLSVSPHSRNLFQNVIIMSGSLFSPIFVRNDTLELSLLLAKHLKCSTQHLIKCLRSKTSAEIKTAIDKLEKPGAVFRAFLPVMDEDFFPDSIENLLAQAPLRKVMIGATKDEMGLYVTPPTKAFTSGWYIEDPESFKYETLRGLMQTFLTHMNFPDVELGTDVILHHYIHSRGDRTNSTFLIEAYKEFVGDYIFVAPVAKDAKMRRDLGSDVWLYSFDYFNPTQAKGAFHFLDMWYVFQSPFCRTAPYTEEEKRISHVYTSLLTNFAKYGKPMLDKEFPKWQPLDEKEIFNHIVVDEPLRLSNYFHKSAHELWNNLLHRLPLINVEKSK